MTEAASGGSTVGSPAAGAVAPGRMSDMAGSGAAPSGTGARSMSDLGLPGPQGAALPGEKMTPLGDNWNAPEPPNTKQPVEVDETQIDPNAEVKEPEAEPQQDGVLTPEQQAAKYQEWMDSDQIPEEFLDRPIWLPDGKNGQIPVRLRDIGNNAMLYNDYQRKTTEVAQMRRQNEQYAAGRQRWIEDMNSGDGERGLRAIRGIGAEKTFEQIVIRYVQNMAKLEGLDPSLRQQVMEGQQAKDRAYFLQQTLDMREREAQQQTEQQNTNAGVNAPDIQYVQQSITAQIPEIYKQQNIKPSPLLEHFLGTMLAEAATGKRGPNGQWIEAPTIQLGRAPSRELLTTLVVAARQAADKHVSSHGQGLTPPPPTKPLQGSGPAAKAGTAGNLSAPKQARFSDLAGIKRPG